MSSGLQSPPSSNVSSEGRFLRALHGANDDRPPVWMMRQAGRYLPSYQALKKKYSLNEMFRTPELICEITKQPVDQLGVDAAILFADILHIPLTLGMEVDFPKGGGIKVSGDPHKLVRVDVRERLSFVEEGIKLLKKDLKVPLIGFCGGPYTVASYMTKKPTHEILRAVTDVSLEYLKMQIELGVDAIQIFDSWAGLLEREEFTALALPYLKELAQGVKGTPVILFTRGGSKLVPELVSCEPTAISFDWERPIAQLRQEVPSHMAVQGNLDPEILRTTPKKICLETQAMLESMRGEKGYIVNLGHGIFPDVPVENARAFIETVQSFSPRSNRGH